MSNVRNVINKLEKIGSKAVDKIMRGTTLDLFGRIVDDTPVDEGALRANWYVSFSSPSHEVDEENKNTNSSNQRVNSQTVRWNLKESIFLTNNMTYADVIENGDKNHRAQKMAARNIALAQSIIKRNAFKFKIK